MNLLGRLFRTRATKTTTAASSQGPSPVGGEGISQYVPARPAPATSTDVTSAKKVPSSTS